MIRILVSWIVFCVGYSEEREHAGDVDGGNIECP